MKEIQLEGVGADLELRRELETRWRIDAGRPVRRAIVVRPGESTTLAVESGRKRKGDRAAPTMEQVLASGVGAEAIVLRFGRPSLIVQADTFHVPASDTWKARLDPTRAKLEAAIRSVGRVELTTLGIPYVGTAWVIAPGIAVTNRHVADRFAVRGANDELAFRLTPNGMPYETDVDFSEEADSTIPSEVVVDRVVYMAEDRQGSPDVAFVAIRPRDRRPLPVPIPLLDKQPRTGQTVVTVGYPAADDRNDAGDQARIFGGVFNVKRLAPGQITGTLDRGRVFTHDCTTLGGSSGSVVVDVETGGALGLHFAGIYLTS